MLSMAPRAGALAPLDRRASGDREACGALQIAPRSSVFEIEDERYASRVQRAGRGAAGGAP